ncbi:hypothetical protein [Saccharicrinis sp. FJH54]|uniref:hypothetical protein n=1 Tax=Saccharicrinis sp. FJH54 TaxID=3344665 RepID=UPI0035D5048B
MKRAGLIFILMIAIQLISAQSLLERYKSGTVKLIPDKTYAQHNDWNKVFASYNDSIYGQPAGLLKSLVMMPDGSVVVNNPNQNFYTKFDDKGNFVNEFGIVNKSGKTFNKIKDIQGVMNGSEFFAGLDNMGNMYCFDFDGNYIKTLKLDYMTRQMIPLGENKFAVVGWVIWKNRYRDFVAIVDYNTNEQKVVWEHFTDRCDSEHCDLFNYSYKFKERGMISLNTMPFSKSNGLKASPQIESTKGKLIIADPVNAEISVYDFSGNFITKDKISWGRNYITVEDQKKIQQKAIEKYKSLENPQLAGWVSKEENSKALKSIIGMMEDDLNKIKDPIQIPVFSNIIKDSDGNLLFFEFPKEEGENKFNVWIYKNNGQFVCQSSIECDDYDLSIMPSKMVFRDGYIYGLQRLKNATGVPLRLVRFKVSN